MECFPVTRHLSALQNCTQRGSSVHVLLFFVVVSLLLVIPGCSLGVIAGKVLFGDPKIKAPFRDATGVDLMDGEKSLLIICSAPHSILSQYPSIQNDIVERMTLTLSTRGIKLISYDDVAAWFDDHGEWGDFSELADKFKADYVMHIEIREFRTDVPDSDNLQQGKADGKVTILDFDKGEGSPVFERVFNTTYPQFPIPRENKSEHLFTEGFLNRTSDTLARMLYDHRVSETVH